VRFFRKFYLFSAKGAVFNGSLGQRPGFFEPKNHSAEGAIHYRTPLSAIQSVSLAESRFQPPKLSGLVQARNERARVALTALP